MSRKLAILSLLYFIQGLPYGFQVMALPVYLRAEGVSLASIGLASFLSLPWSIKVIWGPLVDRFGDRRFGRRKSWIVPLQVGLALACAAASLIRPGGDLMFLVACVLAMNLFASTMDVAVDGLAVDLLERRELGYGNIAQVVGYKLGILTGGGLLVWASETIGWQGLFLSMAALVGLALVFTLWFREPARRPAREAAEGDPTGVVDSRLDPALDPVGGASSMMGVLRALARALRRPGTGWLLLFIATYKLGETMADAMLKPFLYDHGYGAREIGLWLGTYGMAFSLLGSFLGGVLASRIRLLTAVAIAASLRAAAVGGEWWLSVAGPTAERVIAVAAMENLFGGALTTAVFAYMMSRVDRRIGATHFTLLATVEVAGKILASSVAGVVAQALGYPPLFALATTLAVLFLGLLIPVDRAERVAA